MRVSMKDTPFAIGTSMIRLLQLVILLGSMLVFSAMAAKKTPTEALVQPLPATSEVDSEARDAVSTDNDGAKKSGKVTGIYSTLRSVGGDDDLIGLEVIIVRSREGLLAFVQTADGVPGAPVLVPVNVDGVSLSFTIPSTTGEPLQFRGKVTRQGLKGVLDDRPLTLPRHRSYWQ
jgi:hypothetical protein